MVILEIIDDNTIIFNGNKIDAKVSEKRELCMNCAFWKYDDFCRYVPCEPYQRKDHKYAIFTDKQL